MPSRYYQIKPETDDYKIWFLYFSVNELQLYCKSATTTDSTRGFSLLVHNSLILL